MRWFKRKPKSNNQQNQVWKQLQHATHQLDQTEKQNQQEYQTLHHLDQLILQIHHKYQQVPTDDISKISQHYYPMYHILNDIMQQCHQNLDHQGQNTLISVILLLENQVENYCKLLTEYLKIPHIKAYQPYGDIINQALNTLNHVSDTITETCHIIAEHTPEEISTALLHHQAQQTKSDTVRQFDQQAQHVHHEIQQNEHLMQHIQELTADLKNQLQKGD